MSDRKDLFGPSSAYAEILSFFREEAAAHVAYFRSEIDRVDDDGDLIPSSLATIDGDFDLKKLADRLESAKDLNCDTLYLVWHSRGVGEADGVFAFTRDRDRAEEIKGQCDGWVEEMKWSEELRQYI